MSEFNEDKAKEMLNKFIIRHEDRVGLPTSSIQYDSILEIAAKDFRVFEFLRQFEESKVKKDSNYIYTDDWPHIIAYIRGVRCGHAYVIALFRESVVNIFHQEGLDHFDKYSQEYGSAPTDEEFENFWSRLYRYLNDYVNEKVGRFIDENILVFFFRLILTEMERGAAKSSQSIATTQKVVHSVPVQEKYDIALDDVFKLFNPEYPLPDVKPWPSAEADKLVEYLETNHRIISKFNPTDFGPLFVKEFLARSIDKDGTKADETVKEKFKRAQAFEEGVETSRSQAKDAIWKKVKANYDADSKDFSDTMSFSSGSTVKNMTNARKEYDELVDQLRWFAYGSLNVLEVVMLQEWRRMAIRLKARDAYLDLLRRAIRGMETTNAVMKLLITTVLQVKVKSSIVDLAKNLQNEGLVKTVDDSCCGIEMSDQKCSASVSIMPKADRQFSKVTMTLLKFNSNLSVELARCPAVVAPLAAHIKRFSQTNQKKAALLVREPRIARRMGDIIKADFQNKFLLAKSPKFLDLMIRNLAEPRFVEFMNKISEARPRSKKMLFADASLFEKLWVLNSGGLSAEGIRELVDDPNKLQRVASYKGDMKKLLEVLN